MSGNARLGAARLLLRVRACTQVCIFVCGYVPTEIRQKLQGKASFYRSKQLEQECYQAS